MAFAEVRRRSQASTNFTVQVSGTKREGDLELAHKTSISAEMYSLGLASFLPLTPEPSEFAAVVLSLLNHSPILSEVLGSGVSAEH